jgi:hypothetical protein
MNENQVTSTRVLRIDDNTGEDRLFRPLPEGFKPHGQYNAVSVKVGL